MAKRASKRFGQHFLERAWADKLVRHIAPDRTEVFIEIGPGRGALTRPLAAAAAHVHAFEIDRDLAAELGAAGLPNVTIVAADFLQVTAGEIRLGLERAGVSAARVRVAGNLPYNVASPILFKLAELAEAGVPIVDATVMLQREVADRLLARPGSRDYGVLSVLIGYRAQVDRLLALPPGAFRPAPKVHSAVVRLRFREADPRPKNAETFSALTQALFTRRRKMLANALLAYAPAERTSVADLLARSGIDGRRRPETLSIAELVRLSDLLEAAPRS